MVPQQVSLNFQDNFFQSEHSEFFFDFFENI